MLGCRPSSDAGEGSRPESAQQNRKPVTIHESAEDSAALPTASIPAPAAADSAQPADEPAKGAGTQPTGVLKASEPMRALPGDSSSTLAARQALPSTKGGLASGAQPAAGPAKGAATEPTRGLKASEPAKALPGDNSSTPVAQDAPPSAATSAQPAAEGAATRPSEGLKASEPIKALPADGSSTARQVNRDAPSNGAATKAEKASPESPARDNGSAAGNNPTAVSKDGPAGRFAARATDTAAQSQKVDAGKAAAAFSPKRASAVNVDAEGKESAAVSTTPSPAKIKVRQPAPMSLSDALQEQLTATKADMLGKASTTPRIMQVLFVQSVV